MLPILLLAAAISSPSTSVSAFKAMCSMDLSSQAILSRAEKAGWQSSGPGAPADFDKSSQRFKKTSLGLLTLKTSETTSAGETRQTCGVFANYPDPKIVAETQEALGFSPAFSFYESGTWFAALDGSSWRPATTQESSSVARKHGRFYSIMASNADNISMIYDLRVLAPSSS